jgi:hypothetical protein
VTIDKLKKRIRNLTWQRPQVRPGLGSSRVEGLSNDTSSKGSCVVDISRQATTLPHAFKFHELHNTPQPLG